MVKNLFLIRHGHTIGSDTEKRYKGSIDVPLSEKGIIQIRQTAKFISEFLKRDDKNVDDREKMTKGLNAIYCSPLSRALKSAEIIAEPFGITPKIIPDLRERNFGIWEGMTFSEIRDKYPEEFEAWAGNPLIYCPIKGESTIEVRDRVIRALDEILNSPIEQKEDMLIDNKGKDNSLKAYHASEQDHFRINVAIVAHGGVNRIILCHIMGIPLENIFRIEQDYAAVNIIEFSEKYPVVKLLNGGFIG